MIDATSAPLTMDRGVATARRCLTDSRAVAAVQEAPLINLLWLLRLRWVAILGQVATIAAVDFTLGLEIAQPAVLAVIGIEIASNLSCELWARRATTVHDGFLAAILAADVCFLTALLALTGGAHNPFSFLYLIHVALGAVTLPSRWAWGIVTLSSLLFGSLFFLPDKGHGGLHGVHFQMHLQGMWVAFVVAAGVIAYFVQRVTGALARREAELAAVRDLSARHERLVSLTTLAAGAAHELGTPLATIAVAARELEGQIGRLSADDAVRADIELIRAQVQRCRGILQQMTDGTGETPGEPLVAVTLESLLSVACEGLQATPRVRLDLDNTARNARLCLPLQATAQAIRNLVANAIDASPPDGGVVLDATLGRAAIELHVRDQGIGMSARTLERLGEPFFTTKDAGHGMGLGLFLSRSTLVRIGGRLEIASTPGGGTVATVVLPIEAAGRDAAEVS